VDGEILDAEEVTPTDANGPSGIGLGKRPPRIESVRENANGLLDARYAAQTSPFPKDGLKQGLCPNWSLPATNALLFQSWKKMTTGVIAGPGTFGKSSTESVALCALHARAQGLDCKLYPFDPHHNLRIQPGASLSRSCTSLIGVLSMESLEEGKHLELFTSSRTR